MMSHKASENGAEFVDSLKDVMLFRGLSGEEIALCLECSGARCVSYKKGEKIFTEGGEPLMLPVIISGSVVSGRDFYDGKRSIAAVYDQHGDAFGYELLFAIDKRYGLFYEAQTESEILMIPKKFLTGTCERNCGFHSMLISNMLLIMADKSLTLNTRLEIMTCSTLRQKIAKLLLYSLTDGPEASICMSRQEMAEFLNVARPSLSRELMKMQAEGLIGIDGRQISVRNKKALENILR